MEKTIVMVAGLSENLEQQGKMAQLIANAIAKQDDMILYSSALSEEPGFVRIAPDVELELIPLYDHRQVLKEIGGQIDVIVDFTQPKSVNRNAEMYCEMEIPFVMGTTGGDREKLVQTVKNSSISAVIATNMSAPIVVFQEMIKFAAEKFPNAFDGFEITIRESHQASKPDPSGTAVGLLDAFKALGMPTAKDQIKMLRDSDFQRTMLKIPEKYLNGHGYHTYVLESSDGTVHLEFKHNVLGRNTYIDGALRAIRYLAKFEGRKGYVFSMAEVLR
jgi:4-hydroxy-tetrahydrodipicolinate reductase